MKKVLLVVALSVVAAVSGYWCGRMSADEEYLNNFGKIKDVEVYEQMRNRLFDAAFTIVKCEKENWIESCEEEREYCTLSYVDEDEREIILTHDVPNLMVMVRAICQMDERGSLADSYDNEILIEFDEALADYLEYSRQN